MNVGLYNLHLVLLLTSFSDYSESKSDMLSDPNPLQCQGFIQDYILGWGEKQDGSGMIVACETCVCLRGESGGMPARKI